jgi:hypothetical protein
MTGRTKLRVAGSYSLAILGAALALVALLRFRFPELDWGLEGSHFYLIVLLAAVLLAVMLFLIGDSQAVIERARGNEQPTAPVQLHRTSVFIRPVLPSTETRSPFRAPSWEELERSKPTSLRNLEAMPEQGPLQYPPPPDDSPFRKMAEEEAGVDRTYGPTHVSEDLRERDLKINRHMTGFPGPLPADADPEAAEKAWQMLAGGSGKPSGSKVDQAN